MCHGHGKKDGPSSVIPSFFKVMHGNTYTDIVRLPPKFARTVTDLVGQDIQIEDSHGDTWPVKFSYVNGSLVLQEGWPAFYRDHHLEFGDFLVFNYMKKQHFIVHIFDSSACERTKFSPRRPPKNKRPRLNPETLPQNESSQAVDVNTRDKPSSSLQCVSASRVSKCQSRIIRKNVPEFHGNLGKAQHQPIYINVEDPICMLNRDDSHPKEDRSFLQDLSNFEMKKTESGACNIEKSSNDTEMINPSPGGYFPDKLHLKPSEIDNSRTCMPEGVDKTPIDDTGCIQDGNRILTSRGESPSLSCSQVADQGKGSISNSFCLNASSGKEAAIIKKELLESHNKFNPSVTGTASFSSSQVPEQENAFMQKPFAPSILGSKPQNELALSRDKMKPSGIGHHNSIRTSQVSKQENASTPKPFGPHLSDAYSAIKKELVESSGNAGTAVAESSPITYMMPDTVSLKQVAAVKKEPVESGEEVRDLPHISKDAEHLAKSTENQFGQIFSPVVKVEPGLSYDTTRPSVMGSFSAEVKSKSYLVLPACIPAPARKRKGGLGRVVYLKDASGRSWPVLYHDMCYMRVFTDYWRRFCEANNVECGDVCEFQPESQKSLTYRVGVHKPAQSSGK